MKVREIKDLFPAEHVSAEFVNGMKAVSLLVLNDTLEEKTLEEKLRELLEKLTRHDICPQQNTCTLNRDSFVNDVKAAQIIGCSVHKVRQDRLRGGGIPYTKMSRHASKYHGAVRYRVGDILDYMAARQVTSTSATSKAS